MALSTLESKHLDIKESLLNHPSIFALEPKVNPRKSVVDDIGFFDSIRLNAIEDHVLTIQITTVGSESKPGELSGQTNIRLVNTTDSKIRWCTVVSLDNTHYTGFILSLIFFLNSQLPSTSFKNFNDAITENIPDINLKKENIGPKSFRFSAPGKKATIFIKEHKQEIVYVEIKSLAFKNQDYLEWVYKYIQNPKGAPADYALQVSALRSKCSGLDVMLVDIKLALPSQAGKLTLENISEGFKHVDWSMN